MARVSALYFVVLLCVFGFSSQHTLHLGRTCPNVQAFPNLSVDKILGLWYVAYQFDTSNTCLVWNITRPNPNLDELNITESRQLYLLDAVGIDHRHKVTGKSDTPNPELPSKMRIRWYSSLTGKADFTVFDTDYDSYLAIFQCDRAGLLHRRDVTILSRKPAIDDLFVDRVRRLLDTAGIPHDSLGPISHNNCRDNSERNWHIDGELFGLIPQATQSTKDNLREVSRGISDFDISQMEIIGDGISALDDTFRGSMKEKSDDIR